MNNYVHTMCIGAILKSVSAFILQILVCQSTKLFKAIFAKGLSRQCEYIVSHIRNNSVILSMNINQDCRSSEIRRHLAAMRGPIRVLPNCPPAAVTLLTEQIIQLVAQLATELGPKLSFLGIFKISYSTYIWDLKLSK